VLAETVWVLDAVHERSREQIANAIELLLRHESLPLGTFDRRPATREGVERLG